ncbi:hypothetical protein J6590_087745 [Homalodisca vitripennis]|nr:hypothetical protein J6590_087745 [Homalodisca vitripennis]
MDGAGQHKGCLTRVSSVPQERRIIKRPKHLRVSLTCGLTGVNIIRPHLLSMIPLIYSSLNIIYHARKMGTCP